MSRSRSKIRYEHLSRSSPTDLVVTIQRAAGDSELEYRRLMGWLDKIRVELFNELDASESNPFLWAVTLFRALDEKVRDDCEGNTIAQLELIDPKGEDDLIIERSDVDVWFARNR